MPKYSEQILKMISDCQTLIIQQDPSVTNVLKKLLNYGKKHDDNTMIGYAHYYFAFWYYSIVGNHTLFRKHISEAVRYLLRTQERELIASSYNYIAVDAYNNGSFDVAYSYYMTVLQFGLDPKISPINGVAEVNIGRIFMQIDEHQEARKHLRKGISIINRHKKNMLYIQNILISLVSDGLNSIAMNDLKAAKETINRIEKIIANTNQELPEDITVPYHFLKTRYMIHTGTKKQINDLLNKTLSGFKSENRIHEYIDDLSDFCNDLINYHYYDEVNTIINEIQSQVNEINNTHALRLFSEIKVNYYSTINDKRLKDSLLEQHQLMIRHRSEQREIYKASIDLIKIASELRDEQEKVKKENELLQIKAQTDALTGIWNRYAMNTLLDEVFERCYHNKCNFGVEILDIDYFKKFNDTYGHPAGDKCIQMVAKTIKQLAKKENLPCVRYGGDEFVILYENKTDNEIYDFAKLLQKKIKEKNIRYNGQIIKYQIKISQGICNTIPEGKNKSWDFLSQADRSLYYLKSNRKIRNRILINTLDDFG